MKVEKSFTIDGEVVDEVFKKDFQTVYQTQIGSNDSHITLFFVNNKTGEVMFKLVVDADCNQNFGFIGAVEFIEI